VSDSSEAPFSSTRSVAIDFDAGPIVGNHRVVLRALSRFPDLLDASSDKSEYLDLSYSFQPPLTEEEPMSLATRMGPSLGHEHGTPFRKSTESLKHRLRRSHLLSTRPAADGACISAQAPSGPLSAKSGETGKHPPHGGCAPVGGGVDPRLGRAPKDGQTIPGAVAGSAPGAGQVGLSVSPPLAASGVVGSSPRRVPAHGRR
jgi:hypothetical protein